MTLYIREEEIRHEALALGKAEGLAEGKAQGIAEGKAQGIAEGTLKVAAQFYLMGKIALEEALEVSGVAEEHFLKYVELVKDEK